MRKTRRAELRQMRLRLRSEADQIVKDGLMHAQIRGLCHDMNNALTVVRSQTELLEDSLAQNDLSHKRIDRIKRSVGQLILLTRKLNEQHGKNSGEREHLLCDLLSDLKSMVAKSFDQNERSHIRIEFSGVDKLSNVYIQERVGRTYLIVHQLVRLSPCGD